VTLSVCRALAALLFVAAMAAFAQERVPSKPKQFIYFGRDRERINERAFLANPAIAGAQLRYSWRELEPARDRYALQPVLADIAILAAHGKRLFIQVQDVTFSDALPVPDYLRSDEFNGGAERKWEAGTSGARFDGWVARRWDARVRQRFTQLLDTLGRAVDGRIAGINLPETAIGFDGGTSPLGYSPSEYLASVKAMMSAARRAFPRSVVIQYANFMPGDDAPSRPFLHEVYAHAAAIGVGVGGPDILPFRAFQRMNSLPLIAGRPANVLAGMAVQDGNLRDVNPATHRPVTVPELYRYAAEELRLDYIFWGTEEPFYTDEILPFLRTHTPRRVAGERTSAWNVYAKEPE
jgi:hypothetical protein